MSYQDLHTPYWMRQMLVKCPSCGKVHVNTLDKSYCTACAGGKKNENIGKLHTS